MHLNICAQMDEPALDEWHAGWCILCTHTSCTGQGSTASPDKVLPEIPFRKMHWNWNSLKPSSTVVQLYHKSN